MDTCVDGTEHTCGCNIHVCVTYVCVYLVYPMGPGLPVLIYSDMSTDGHVWTVQNIRVGVCNIRVRVCNIRVGVWDICVCVPGVPHGAGAARPHIRQHDHGRTRVDGTEHTCGGVQHTCGIRVCDIRVCA